jgi:7-cyano-7-deazaguanine tRNA-ribosyltransferase
LLIVVGFPLRWPIPVWRSDHALGLPGVTSVMVSFGELQQRPLTYQSCLRQGLRRWFRVSGEVFLDNGAFRLNRLGARPDISGYVAFVRQARPQWYPVPFDYMPTPAHSRALQRRKIRQTNSINLKYAPLGYVPVIHAGPLVDKQFRQLRERMQIPRLAIGGLVPYLRHLNGTDRYDVIQALGQVGRDYNGKLHIFGVGGLVSLHIAALLSASSVDSAGWQVRAVHGVITLPLEAGQISTRTRYRTGFSKKVRDAVRACPCVACTTFGREGLFESGRSGFVHRSVHNLSMLLNENALIERMAERKDLRAWVTERFRSSPYSRLVAAALDVM